MAVISAVDGTAPEGRKVPGKERCDFLYFHLLTREWSDKTFIVNSVWVGGSHWTRFTVSLAE